MFSVDGASIPQFRVKSGLFGHNIHVKNEILSFTAVHDDNLRENDWLCCCSGNFVAGK